MFEAIVSFLYKFSFAGKIQTVQMFLIGGNNTIQTNVFNLVWMNENRHQDDNVPS